MISRWLPRAAFVSAAAGVLSIAMATAASAVVLITHPYLHQANQDILATNKEYDLGFGECTDGQKADEDIWVFVWPGQGVVSVDEVKIGWDTNNDGTADTFKMLADGHYTTDSGTFKVWFATPTGWKLETGESTIHGTVASFKAADGDKPQDDGFFNLTHTCAGTTTQTTPPVRTTPPTPSTSSSTSTTTPPVTVSTSPSTPGLPVTGAAVGGIALAGLALVGAGVALVVARRRRDNPVFKA